MYPKARTDGLSFKKLGNELVVYDANNGGSVHLLNRMAEVVWRSCDGRTDAAALTRIVGRTTGIADSGPAVELALEQLSRRGLLETSVDRATPERRRDRREALKHLATALAIPTVLTVTAIKARANSFCSITCPDGKTVLPGQIYSGVCQSLGICPGAGTISCVGVSDNSLCFTGKCCRGLCVPLALFQSDNANCGSCGNVCQTFQTCQNGQCVGQG